ncbi:MAG: hypothetical protein AcusKO_26280 [Acuticoccus sp.]
MARALLLRVALCLTVFFAVGHGAAPAQEQYASLRLGGGDARYFFDWFVPGEPEPEERRAPPSGPRFDGDSYVTSIVLPTFDKLVDRSLALQNAVLRHCLVDNDASRAALIPAYLLTIEASAGLVPIAFGSSDAKEVPARLLAETGGIGFSREELETAIVSRTEKTEDPVEAETEVPAPAPVTPKPPGLGLPSLEMLLLQANYPEEQPLETRCALAEAVVADIVDIATRARQRWLTGDVDPHWRVRGGRLGDRKRLYDLVQGTIDAADLLASDLEQFFRHVRGEQAFRFADRRLGMGYILAGIDGLKMQLARMETLVGPDPHALERFETIARTLTAAAMMLDVVVDGTAENHSICLLTFEHARADIVEHTPQVFSFELGEFSRARIDRFRGEAVN